jgi:hypothetical protein
MEAYFAICVLMAQVKKPNLQSYWSNCKSLHIPFFSEVLNFRRFVLLSKFLHFADDENLPENDHLRKLGPVLSHLKQNFREVYYPQENVAGHSRAIPLPVFRLFIGPTLFSSSPPPPIP